MGTFYRLAIAAVFLSLLVFLTKCAEDSTDPGSLSTIHDASYLGQGSLWEWDLNDTGTFTATQKNARSDTSPILEITGTYAKQSNGFYVFTAGANSSDITCNSCTNAPAPGSTFEGFGIPNVLLIAKVPGGSDPEPLIMAPVGACPSGAVSFNWISAKPEDSQDSDVSSQRFWGNLTVATVPGAVSGTEFTLAGTEFADQNYTTTASCESGIIALDGSVDDGTGLISISSTGTGIIKTSTSQSLIGIPRDVNISTSSLNERFFVGFLFEEDNANESTVTPITLEFSSTGAGTYKVVTDVTSGTTSDTGTITISEAGTGEKAGFLKLTLTDPNSNEFTLWVAVKGNLSSTGRTVLLGAGLDNTSSQNTLSLMAIQN